MLDKNLPALGILLPSDPLKLCKLIRTAE